MSHFAQIQGGIVVQVIVAEQDFIDTLPDASEWVQTSYNTQAPVDPATTLPSQDQTTALRKNYAGIGYAYDTVLDAFIPPKPYPSWGLDEATCQWAAPTAHPDDGKKYTWDEDTTSWVGIRG